MTPLQLQMMLHYYTRPAPFAEHEPDHAKSPAVREQRIELVMADLLKVCCGNESGYIITDKGKAFVNALCSTPLPVCKWVIPERTA